MLRAIALLTIFLITALVSAQDENTLPISEDVTYTVRPADTVDVIGALFDVSPTCIAEMNELDKNNTIMVGQELLISVACPRYGQNPHDEGELPVVIPREVVTYEEACTGYIVQRLDSLDVIGQALNVSVQAIQDANGLFEDSSLEIGMCLEIPDDAPPYGVYPPLDIADELNPTLGQGGALIPGEPYVVQPLDTLDVIGQRLNVSVVSIMLANNLASGRLIQPGMTLMIPADAPPYGTYPAITTYETPAEVYLVQSDDTLESIAEQFDVALLALELANDIDSEADIFPGRALLIPANVPGYGEDDQFVGLGEQGGGGPMMHIVQPLETLDVIAAFYDKDRACLASANNLAKPGQLRPGQLLVIEESCGPYIGDSVIPPLKLSVAPAGADNSSEESDGGDG